MSKSFPSHIEGLLAYLSRPEEKANEDLATGYFRKVFGSAFTRQQDAKRSDGYVAGHFVLELKGKTNDWLSGLFQGLAYKNSDLAFSQIVVACKSFLAVWQVDQLPDNLREEILMAKGSPSAIGKLFAKQYSKKKNELLGRAIWKSGVELSGSLFKAQPEQLALKIESFERTLKEGRKVRQRITINDFTKALTEMKMFFDPTQPIKAVRAFYSMLYGWNETSVLKLSEKVNDQAALGGESITNLVPALRHKFKDFVESRVIFLGPDEHHDDFFARYDSALDAVDKDFRIKHGIFFTDLDLSKFVMWFVRRDIPNLEKSIW